MGALDKRIFSGVAIVSALLFVVSAVMLLANGGEVSDDANDIALYIVTVAGILAVVYAAVLVMDRSSVVRTVSGALTAVAGVMFLAAPFAGGSTGVLLAAASIVAAAAIVADMLAHWVSRVYGAMYVSAVLAAVDLAMGALYFVDSPQATYPAIALVAFGVWLALSAYVTGFVRVESEVKVREVKEDKQTNKASKPQAKNTKATKKAKKPERKPEPKPAEVVPEPEPVPEEVPVAPVEEPEESEPVVSPVVEDVQSGPEPVVGEVELGSTDIKEEGEEVLGEDLYTDYSPEAVVRRAAWNKGLRCRRNYGPYNIPVAFVKGKVAVFVDDGDADTSIDTTLADQGWTVLRYDASTVTDGKAQGDEIAAAVKSNLRSAKAAAKKKSKK